MNLTLHVWRQKSPADEGRMVQYEVTGVTVAIRDGEGAIIQQGAALFVDGLWHYTTTIGIAREKAVTIEAVAKDRPGHFGTLVLPHVIA